MSELQQICDSRELFHAACAGVKTTRPPFWIMRQAGRYLPEYRALKEKYGFLGIVKTPEASVEAALQPIRRFDFDCSIMFSDILAVSEALGFPYKFKDGGGIVLERKVESIKDIEEIAARADDAIGNLSYVFDNIKMLRRELPHKAIFGFCGAPFTLAAYMVEGESSKDFPKYRAFFEKTPELFFGLMSSLEYALSKYCMRQVQCGVDAIQIFDSHAGLTPLGKYAQYSGDGVAQIFANLDGRTRTSLFANGMGGRFGELLCANADIYSLDSSQNLSNIMEDFSSNRHFALQGNLNPLLLAQSSPEDVAEKTRENIADMRKYSRHIFNLGHGITPDAKLKNVEALCESVKNFKD